jgi:hypothetical protein
MGMDGRRSQVRSLARNRPWSDCQDTHLQQNLALGECPRQPESTYAAVNIHAPKLGRGRDSDNVRNSERRRSVTSRIVLRSLAPSG